MEKERQIFSFREISSDGLRFLRAVARRQKAALAFWTWVEQRCDQETARRDGGHEGQDSQEFPKLSPRDAALARNELAILIFKLDRSTDSNLVGLVAQLGLMAGARLENCAAMN